jgi:hypothetical protein
MTHTLKQIVEEWLKTKNYDEGIEIMFAYRPQMSRIFRGREKTYAGKLEYELKKLAGITNVTPTETKPEPPVEDPKAKIPEPEQKTVPAKTPEPPIPSAPAAPIKTKQVSNKNKTTPAFITRIIKEHAKLFKLRSKLSSEREAIPQKNHPTYNLKRKLLSESIQQHSLRIEMLYNAKEDYYERSIQPDMSILFPEQAPEGEAPVAKPKQPKSTKTKPKPKKQ